MIVQGILDWLSHNLAMTLDLLPPLPVEWSQMVGAVTDGGQFIGEQIGKFSPLLPLDVFNTIINVWVGLWVFWAALLAVRLVLWMFGR